MVTKRYIDLLFWVFFFYFLQWNTSVAIITEMALKTIKQFNSSKTNWDAVFKQIAFK